MESFNSILTGGHSNSLGRTIEVVETVLADRSRLLELVECYRSDDPVVRLRTSNALKRIETESHEWLLPFMDRLIDDLGTLDRASAQWTVAQLFLKFGPELTPDQCHRATNVMKRNLERSDDWIVLNATMETLAQWSIKDPGLKSWLAPHLSRLAKDSRKSVAGRAKKLAALDQA